MKNRIFEVHDSGTEMYCMVTQFEKIDQDICKKIGIPIDYKIINVFGGGSSVCTFAGYNFDPEYFENKVFTEKYEGTYKAIGNIINSTKDIRYLPEVFDVEATRNFYNHIKSGSFNITDALEKISDNDNGNDNLRKILIKTEYAYIIRIYDIEKKEEIFGKSSFGTDEKYCVPEYLWLPIKELDKSLIPELVKELHEPGTGLDKGKIKKIMKSAMGNSPFLNETTIDDFFESYKKVKVILPK